MRRKVEEWKDAQMASPCGLCGGHFPSAQLPAHVAAHLQRRDSLRCGHCAFTTASSVRMAAHVVGSGHDPASLAFDDATTQLLNRAFAALAEAEEDSDKPAHQQVPLSCQQTHRSLADSREDAYCVRDQESLSDGSHSPVGSEESSPSKWTPLAAEVPAAPSLLPQSPPPDSSDEEWQSRPRQRRHSNITTAQRVTLWQELMAGVGDSERLGGRAGGRAGERTQRLQDIALRIGAPYRSVKLWFWRKECQLEGRAFPHQPRLTCSVCLKTVLTAAVLDFHKEKEHGIVREGALWNRHDQDVDKPIPRGRNKAQRWSFWGERRRRPARTGAEQRHRPNLTRSSRTPEQTSGLWALLAEVVQGEAGDAPRLYDDALARSSEKLGLEVASVKRWLVNRRRELSGRPSPGTPLLDCPDCRGRVTGSKALAFHQKHLCA